jgi:hypothetical protein
MAVLRDTVILFSDKSRAFPDTGDEKLDWSRWHRRAMRESWDQLAIAGRWVRTFPGRTFLDRKCTRPLPVALPQPDKIRVFPVAVVFGASERCRQKYPGGSGSLFLSTVWPGDDASEVHPQTFDVNIVHPTGEIHDVLNEVSLPILLRELDTLPDLIEDLAAKESLIRQRRVVAIAGEEELIGLFLGIRAGIADLEIPADTRCMIAEGIDADILTRPQYRKHHLATAPSYFWDSIIQYQSAATLNGTLVPGSLATIKENEEILRLLAAQPRLYRRFLGSSCLDLYRTAPRDRITSRAMNGAGDTIFVFRIHPSDGKDSAEQRHVRQPLLQSYCVLTAWRNREEKKVVGVYAMGIAPDRDGFDLVAIEVLGWTEEAIAAGHKLAEQHGQVAYLPLAPRVAPLPHPFAWTPKEATHMAVAVAALARSLGAPGSTPPSPTAAARH